MSASSRRVCLVSGDAGLAAVAPVTREAPRAGDLMALDLTTTDDERAKSAAILCHNLTVERLIACWAKHPSAAFVGRGGADAGNSLAIMARSVLAGRGRDVADFLAPGTALMRLGVATRDEAVDAAMAAQQMAEGVGPYPDFADTIALNATEMLSNALRETAALLTMGADREMFVLSVEDLAGTLTRDAVLQNLARCAKGAADQIRQTSRGAGLGLFLLMQGSTWLEFRVKPGVSTTVTLAARICKMVKQFDAMARTVAYFEERS